MAYVEVDLYHFDDDDLRTELESRGYSVSDRPILSDVDKLYRCWQQDSREIFEKNLKQFFMDYLNLVSV